PDTSKNRGTVCRALLGFDNFDFVVVDVGLDLAPQGRTRAASAEADILNGDIHFIEDGERVFKAKGDTFEYGAHDMAARVRSGQAGEYRAGVRVEVWRALTHEIGSPEQAVRSGRSRGGFGGEDVIGIGAGLCGEIRRELIAKPAQRESCRLRDAHDVPASGNGVAEGVKAASRIE